MSLPTKTFPWLLVVISLPSCKSVATDSGVMHDFSNTKAATIQPMGPCVSETPDALKAEAAYITKLAEVIMKGNPQTFNGNLDPSKFCFSVLANRALNASADSHHGHVLMQMGVIELAGNDASIAGVLAHELSHITMQHGDVVVHPKLLKSPDWIRVNFQLMELSSSNEAKRRESESTIVSGRNARAEFLSSKSGTNATIAGLKKDIGNLFSSYMGNIAGLPKVLQKDYDDLSIPVSAEFIDYLMDALANVKPNPQPVGESDVDFRGRESELLAKMRTTKLQLQTEQMKTLNAEDAKTLGTYDAMLTEQSQQLEVMLAPEEAKRKELSEIVAGIIDRDADFNWKEQEADEVGFELYLRAGFDPAYFDWIQKSILSKNLKDCIDRIQTRSTSIARGQDDHPDMCWRLYNLEILEAKKHKNDYAPLLKGATRVTVFKDELAGFKTK